MWVIKLGGSLTESPLLLNWLALLANQRQRNVVIVPGGGDFAEQVRSAQKQWQFDDRCAHYMAILAMQQMAWLFKGLQPALEIVSLPEQMAKIMGHWPRTWLWSPQIEQLDQAAIPATWDVTSDSLAAWLAGQLGAEQLIMVKSATIACDVSLQQLELENIVDKAFNWYARDAGIAVDFFHRDQLESFTNFFTQ